MEANLYHETHEKEEEEGLESDGSFPSRVNIQFLPVTDDNDEFSDSSSLASFFSDNYTVPNIAELNNRANFGSLPPDSKLEKIFQRFTTQLDFLNRTVKMMNHRLNIIQYEVNDMKRQNGIE
ncbi:hypothetical protein TRFO_21249 [Tritrichomonas foetus]|uniref:Uncharacterized protein n=1 Tax=Tritrichomonas foetus TaxID=1144522 RepID=A0A1J4KJ80_9EUKA|nr:hypothetical protein TRFO_21249 [Tritrichomonas foetus]|eukprot:OHT09734.1 hypothetical protein TRFO_21249 [Tritrichomonas foetus]